MEAHKRFHQGKVVVRGKGHLGPYYKIKLELKWTQAKFYQLSASLSVILLLTKLTKLKTWRSLRFHHKKETDKLAINRQNFAQVCFQNAALDVTLGKGKTFNTTLEPNRRELQITETQQR